MREEKGMRTSMRVALFFLAVSLAVLPATVSAAKKRGGPSPVYIPLVAPPVTTENRVEVKTHGSLERVLANSVAFSSDGRLLASGGRGNEIILYDAVARKVLKKLTGKMKVVYSVAFSPDGRYLASGDHMRNVAIWGVQSGRAVKILKGHRSVVYAVAFSPDGRTVASAGKGRMIILWDVRSGRQVRTLGGKGVLAYSLAFSPDGRILAGGGHDRMVHLWDTGTGKEIRVLKGHRSAVKSVVFSPDGRLVASGGQDRDIRLWDTATGRTVRILKGHRKPVSSIAFSPDGSLLVSGGLDRTVMIWNTATGRPVKKIDKHASSVISVAMSGGGLLATAGKDRKLYLWKIGAAAPDIGSIARMFRKGEFETTREFRQRVKGTAYYFRTAAVLGHYDADRGGYTITFAGQRAFVRVPRDTAREMKQKGAVVYVEGGLRYHDPKKAELVNAYLVDTLFGNRFPFGRHLKGLKVVSLGGQGATKTFVKGAPKLDFSARIRDENGNGVFEGGERIEIAVKIGNAGKGSASGVRILLSGDRSVTDVLGSEKYIGMMSPGEEREVVFSGVLPNELKAGNTDIRVTVKESRGYSPRKVSRFAVAMKPADIEERAEVLSRLTDVDILPKKQRGAECRDCYALVIGISKYRSIPAVKYAAKDAEIVSKYLERVAGVPPANIKLLRDDSATLADIASSVEEWLPRRAKKSSRVFVYYAGHGTPDPKTNEAFIVPYEGEPGYRTKLYPLKRLYASLQKLPTDRVFVMLDSCFSGSGGRSVIPKGSRPVSLSIENPILASGKVVVLAAAKNDQISSDYDRVQHGLFTYFLLKGLRGEADSNRDGFVEVDELYRFVRDRVAETAVRELDRDQTPMLLPGPEQIKGRKFRISRVR